MGGRTRAYNLLLLLLEMRNCKFLPRTGGPTLGWAPKTQRKGFSGNSRAGLRGAGCLAFVPEAGSRHHAPRGGAAGSCSGADRAPSGPQGSFQFCAVSAVVCPEQEAKHTRNRAGQALAQTPDWPGVAALVDQVTFPPQAPVSHR